MVSSIGRMTFDVFLGKAGANLAATDQHSGVTVLHLMAAEVTPNSPTVALTGEIGKNPY